ncbi:pantoate--beta-alanine ligase [Croceicoccus sp. F390]|uniref:Pantothenate synthetase n=1 Tax=Croceicoccus esteveae TaxID=3075597 RepID=A0ABU2ZGJ0_9SPHN|nr:pantoate--beta-alanine ligase [Croceicoccus sp. F390]MDT0575708.1 pantoate--beta-alanine ligase [Croceicoccus sp. F390]
MQTLHAIIPLRQTIADLRKAAGPDARLALVPTMGALHDGHLALVRAARQQAQIVAVSIFVNPRQFGANEDLDAYPRTLAADAALLEAQGVDVLWAPAVSMMYPHDYATNISVGGVSQGLCGADRPGHFDGVATVVLKLFNQVAPDLAFFGEKDWQQLGVIRRMARDLDLAKPHVDAIYGVPIVREPDGLALSSRNRYLSGDARVTAAALPQFMQEAVRAMAKGDACSEALARLRCRLLERGFDSIDYAELRDERSLLLLDRLQEHARLFVAARIGGTRLIDNLAATVGPTQEDRRSGS